LLTGCALTVLLYTLMTTFGRRFGLPI
jgi:hypothetical protein